MRGGPLMAGFFMLYNLKNSHNTLQNSILSVYIETQHKGRLVLGERSELQNGVGPSKNFGGRM